MKHTLSVFALIIGSLFAPVAVSAAPLVCNGPAGLTYALASSCAAANVGVFPGFTVGNCLVVLTDFSFGGGACGGGGGSPLGTFASFQTGSTSGTTTISAGSTDTLAGITCNYYEISTIRTTVGPPGIPTLCIHQGSGAGGSIALANISAIKLSVNGLVAGLDVPGAIAINGAASLLELGTNAAATCSGVDGSGLSLIVAGSTQAETISASLSEIGYCFPVFVPAITNSGIYTDSSANSATMQLGQAAPPSGVCISGSIYTNAAGTTLATTRYTCVAAGWIGG